MYKEQIELAKEHFAKILERELARVERMKSDTEVVDFSNLPKTIIGIVGGDGIGPFIAEQTQKVLEHLLHEKIANGKIELRVIEGLTIENRIAKMQAIPDDVLAQLKECHLILKNYYYSSKGDGMPNIESANVAMRRNLICLLMYAQ